ncbi:MAG: hypothetical protein AB7S65_02335 [Sulfuricurvum sp.]
MNKKNQSTKKNYKPASFNDKNAFIVHRDFTGVLVSSKYNLPSSAILASALLEQKKK